MQKAMSINEINQLQAHNDGLQQQNKELQSDLIFADKNNRDERSLRLARNDDYKSEYKEFWQNIVENKDGTLNKEQVMKELSDFSFILEQLPRIYMAVTGDKLSKTMYYANTIITCFEEHLNDVVEQAIEDYKEESEVQP